MEGENTNEPLVSCGKPFLPRKDEIDLGDLGLWSVSSAKPGFGVENLRDDSVHTLWQSEGPQPHFIRIEFPKRTIVTVANIYLCRCHIGRFIYTLQALDFPGNVQAGPSSGQDD